MVIETIRSRKRWKTGQLAGQLCRVLVLSALVGSVTGCGTAANKGRSMTNSLARLMPWKGKAKGKDDADSQKLAEEAPRPKKPARDALRIGRIIHVERDKGFALIRSKYGNRLATGTEIKGHLANGEEACSLRCSPERKPGYIVADIVSGDPQEGQDVFVDQGAVKVTESGSIAVPGPGSRTLSSRSIPGLPPMEAGSTGVDSLPPVPVLPDSVPMDELPDFPID
ncbi:MAG: hypothetical protein ACI9R3_006194 [Verrucomicrobiales bacterium]|jgi:hypothetical protein